MHARVVTGQYQQGTLEEAAHMYRDLYLPAAEQQQGFKGALFLTDPNTHWNWFAAIEVPAPAPETPGSTQTLVVSGLDPGHNWNFAMKATVVAGR